MESSEFGDSNFEMIDYESDSAVAIEDESSLRGGDLHSNKGEDEIGGMMGVSKPKRKVKTMGQMLQN